MIRGLQRLYINMNTEKLIKQAEQGVPCFLNR